MYNEITTKEEILETILKQFASNSKVNFDDNSLEGDGKSQDMGKVIEDYAKENKCSYAQAYKSVMKNQKE